MKRNRGEPTHTGEGYGRSYKEASRSMVHKLMKEALAEELKKETLDAIVFRVSQSENIEGAMINLYFDAYLSGAAKMVEMITGGELDIEMVERG